MDVPSAEALGITGWLLRVLRWWRGWWSWVVCPALLSPVTLSPRSSPGQVLTLSHGGEGIVGGGWGFRLRWGWWLFGWGVRRTGPTANYVEADLADSPGGAVELPYEECKTGGEPRS